MTFDDLRNIQGLIGPPGGGKSGQKKMEKHFVFLLKHSVGRFSLFPFSPQITPRGSVLDHGYRSDHQRYSSLPAFWLECR